MKKMILLLFLIIPFVVKAEERIESIDIKYYKTVAIIPNNTIDENLIISHSYLISEEEYNNPEENYTRSGVTVETTYKKLTVTISSSGSGYKYKAKLHWKKMPSKRSYDIMSLAYYASVVPSTDPVFYQEYCNQDGNCYTSYTYFQKNGYSALGAMFHLPSGNLASLDQTFYVYVMKENPNATVIQQKAVADYSHATKTITYNNAKKFTVSLGGISLDSSIISYYDEIPYAEATWSGTW